VRSEKWEWLVRRWACGARALGVVSERGVSGGVGDAGASERKNGCAAALMEAHLVVIVAGMNVALTAHWEGFIRRMIESGRYNNASEVVRVALRKLDGAEGERFPAGRIEHLYTRAENDGEGGGAHRFFKAKAADAFP